MNDVSSSGVAPEGRGLQTSNLVDGPLIDARHAVPSAKVMLSINLHTRCMRGNVEWHIPVSMLNKLNFRHGAIERIRVNNVDAAFELHDPLTAVCDIFASHGDMGTFSASYEVAADAAQEGEIRIFPVEELSHDAYCAVCIDYCIQGNIGAVVFADDVDEAGRRLPYVYTRLGSCQGGGVLGASSGPRTVIPCFDDLHTKATYEVRMVVDGFMEDFAGVVPAFRSDVEDCTLRLVAAGNFSSTDGVYRTPTAILAHAFGFVLGPFALLERPASVMQMESSSGGVSYLCPPQLCSLALTLCVRGRKMLRFLLSKTGIYSPCCHVHVFLPSKVLASHLLHLADRPPSSFSASPLDILPFSGFSCYPAEWLVVEARLDSRADFHRLQAYAVALSLVASRVPLAHWTHSWVVYGICGFLTASYLETFRETQQKLLELRCTIDEIDALERKNQYLRPIFPPTLEDPAVCVTCSWLYYVYLKAGALVQIAANMASDDTIYETSRRCLQSQLPLDTRTFLDMLTARLSDVSSRSPDAGAALTGAQFEATLQYFLTETSTPHLVFAAHFNRRFNQLEVVVEQVLQPGKPLFHGVLPFAMMEKREEGEGTGKTWSCTVSINDIRHTENVACSSTIKRKNVVAQAEQQKKKKHRKPLDAPEPIDNAVVKCSVDEEINNTPVYCVVVDPDLWCLVRWTIVMPPAWCLNALAARSDCVTRIRMLQVLGSYGSPDCMYSASGIACPVSFDPPAAYLDSTPTNNYMELAEILQKDATAPVPTLGYMLRPSSPSFAARRLAAILFDTDPLVASALKHDGIRPLGIHFTVRSNAAFSLAKHAGSHLPCRTKVSSSQDYFGSMFCLVAFFKRQFTNCSGEKVDFAHVESWLHATSTALTTFVGTGSYELLEGQSVADTTLRTAVIQALASIRLTDGATPDVVLIYLLRLLDSALAYRRSSAVDSAVLLAVSMRHTISALLDSPHWMAHGSADVVTSAILLLRQALPVEMELLRCGCGMTGSDMVVAEALRCLGIVQTAGCGSVGESDVGCLLNYLPPVHPSTGRVVPSLARLAVFETLVLAASSPVTSSVNRDAIICTLSEFLQEQAAACNPTSTSLLHAAVEMLFAYNILSDTKCNVPLSSVITAIPSIIEEHLKGDVEVRFDVNAAPMSYRECFPDRELDPAGASVKYTVCTDVGAFDHLAQFTYVEKVAFGARRSAPFVTGFLSACSNPVQQQLWSFLWTWVTHGYGASIFSPCAQGAVNLLYRSIWGSYAPTATATSPLKSELHSEFLSRLKPTASIRDRARQEHIYATINKMRFTHTLALRHRTKQQATELSTRLLLEQQVSHQMAGAQSSELHIDMRLAVSVPEDYPDQDMPPSAKRFRVSAVG